MRVIFNPVPVRPWKTLLCQATTAYFLFLKPRTGRRMSGTTSKNPMDNRQEIRAQRWWAVMLRDPHWWVPVTVLVGGLILLQWIR